MTNAISCGTANVPLCIVQGDTKLVVLTFVDGSGNPVDTTGWILRSQVRYGDADNTALLAEFDVTWDANEASLRLEATITDEIPFTYDDLYAWDVKVDDGTSVVTPVAGSVTVQPAVTRESL